MVHDKVGLELKLTLSLSELKREWITLCFIESANSQNGLFKRLSIPRCNFKNRKLTTAPCGRHVRSNNHQNSFVLFLPTAAVTTSEEMARLIYIRQLLLC